MGTRRIMNIIVDTLYKGNNDMKEAKNDVNDLGEAATTSSFSMGDLAKAGAVAAAGLAAAGVAAQVAYQTIGEGADLIAAEQKFGNLAVSIDTTADALLGKMRSATQGLVSDAQLVAAGTDIMNLGLAKTEDGVVRMASAVGALNLDMGVLALTLANDSTARLDSLGLSLEAVTAKKKELIASGFIGDAFDEAVLISLEEKMVLLGDASETTAGQMAIIEAQAANLSAEFKILAATSAGPLITGLSGAVSGQNKLNEGIAAGVIDMQEWNSIINSATSINEGNAQAIDIVNERLDEQATELNAAKKQAADYLLYQRAIAGELANMESSVTGLTLAQIYGADAQEAANDATAEGIRITAQNAHASEQDAIARDAVTDAMKAQRDAIKEVREAQEKATAATGDYFTKALDTENALISYNRTVQTSGGLTADQTENLGDLRSEQEKIIGTISSLQGGTAGLGLSSDDLNKKLEEQYSALALVEGAMSPLAGVTTDVIGVTEEFRVNQEVVNSSLYASADAAGASATELALLGLATGDLTEEQAEAALKSAAMAVEIERLGTSIAEGMDPQEALNRLEAFQDGLDAQDFSVRLGIEVEEDTTKAKEKADDTFDSFVTGADTATADAKGFFVDFSEVVTGEMAVIDESFIETQGQMMNINKAAEEIKNRLFGLTETTHVINVKIKTEGSLPSGLTNGNPAVTSTSVANEMAR